MTNGGNAKVEVWPWLEQNGKSETEGERYTSETVRVFTVIDTFFRALENGTVEMLRPDPRYERPGGKPPLTEDQVNRVITDALDSWFEAPQNANYAKNTRGIPHDLPPALRRLAFPQRLALVQQLEQALDPASPPPPPSPTTE